MKRIKKVFILLLVLLLASGCSMKMEYNVAIKSDKSMDFSVVYMFDDEMLTMLIKDDEGLDSSEEVTYSDRQKWDYIEKTILADDEEIVHAGFIRERYETDDYKGYRFTKNIKDIESVTGTSANFNIEDFYKIETDKLFTKKDNHYQLNLTINDEENLETGLDYKEFVEAKFTIMLPEKSISNNATEVSEDGKILTWDLSKVANVNLEFDIPSSNAMMMYIIIGIVAVIVLFLIFTFIHNRKKRNDYRAPQPKEDLNEYGTYTNSMNQTTPMEPPISMGNGQGMNYTNNSFPNNSFDNNATFGVNNNSMMNNNMDNTPKSPVLIQDQMPQTEDMQNMTVASTFGSVSMMANTNQQDTNTFRFLGGEAPENQTTAPAPNTTPNQIPSFAETKELPQDAMKTKVCPNCGAKLAGDATVCFLCGRKV